GRTDHLLHRHRRLARPGDGGHRRLPRLPDVGQGRADRRRGARGVRRPGRGGVLLPRRLADQGRVHAALPVVGRRAGHLDPGRGQDAQGPRRGLRAARPRQRVHRGDLPPGARRLHPAHRDAQAQGREDPHRHRPQGPEEARRVSL
ncbi:MAG: FIG01121307: hypothetical protein, partial [uncultured Nocardioides sp.]